MGTQHIYPHTRIATQARYTHTGTKEAWPDIDSSDSSDDDTSSSYHPHTCSVNYGLGHTFMPTDPQLLARLAFGIEHK